MDLVQQESELHFNLSRLIESEFNCFVSYYYLNYKNEYDFNTVTQNKSTITIVVEQCKNSTKNLKDLIDRDGNELYFGYSAFVTSIHSEQSMSMLYIEHTFDIVINDIKLLNEHLSNYLYIKYSNEFDKLIDKTLQS